MTSRVNPRVHKITPPLIASSSRGLNSARSGSVLGDPIASVVGFVVVVSLLSVFSEDASDLSPSPRLRICASWACASAITLTIAAAAAASVCGLGAITLGVCSTMTNRSLPSCE
jgi:hypothetical protein